MMQRYLIVVALLLNSCSAFTIISPSSGVVKTSSRFTSSTSLFAEEGEKKKLDTNVELAEPGRNPDRPELPELKGDFDWDEKFGGDDDWITENVPGKTVLNEIALAEQVTKLDALEEKWRKARANKEYQSARLLGWTEQAETYNGRFAMFFLVVGILTEAFTGISMPGQVEEMLRITGVLGFDG
mmetsp:Transcript_31893/g.52614  ORF Transcript_31893/g.52614 Transcript_31893/m.52614 type:complete len:184 (-) Transcript_31893:221-772(-)|eukprot:CAMPEP_0119013168 /NCGR_PEP_ID=MMETSP1176-20130426/8065_1 /TAXON_ID=265551 /ORGANISM="Synedropsis recta cf, Strain CCMP1620" /LENGTH=183 /DNA_ID=CAMNT_0006966227 /DNA_START=74 /DNA_END=625 /DNA_ORIENTATION=-